MLRLAPVLFVLLLVLTGCADTVSQQAIADRNAAIANEPLGDYYIGRRFAIERTQFWGYLRKPRQTWDQAKLVIFDESQMHQPDRVKELPTDNGPAHGFDHNFEYHIWGYYSGKQVYDPNSDLFLPEFVLTRYQLVNDHPGWLFNPRERFDGAHLLRWNSQDTATSGH